jgi:hypothetical protein
MQWVWASVVGWREGEGLLKWWACAVQLECPRPSRLVTKPVDTSFPTCCTADNALVFANLGRGVGIRR